MDDDHVSENGGELRAEVEEGGEGVSVGVMHEGPYCCEVVVVGF